METANLYYAVTQPLPHTTSPSHQSPVVSRIPTTLSGPVRARRPRRLFRRSHQAATAQLKGTALVVTSPTGGVLAALDVQHVTRISDTRVHIRSEAPPAVVELSLIDRPAEWQLALARVAGMPGARLSDFRVVSPIGKGGGGAVYLVKEVGGDGSPLAMKVVQKHDVFYSNGSLRHALDERVVLELVRGFPFVITLRHAFQTEQALYMVSDFCSGGDLRTMLKRAKRGRLSEQRARLILAQIVLAIEHLHSLNVIYRDVKPENVLLSADGDVRLCDFGLSKVLSTGRFGRTKSFCGSTSYMSPQIITGKNYGIATDMWSLGALFYRVLVGRAPFDESAKYGARNEPVQIERRIQLEEPTYPTYLSQGAREMIQGLLQKKEEDRMNLQDLKEALFFEGLDWEELLQDGYERAVERTDTLLDDDELDNFDAKRLVSHGVALRDKELETPAIARKRPGDKPVAPEQEGFLRRQSSKLAGFSSRKRSEILQRKLSSTSIVGFGYSSASDLQALNWSGNASESETSSSVHSS